MKLTRSEFQNYIYSYETDEIFYRDLYLAEKEHPETGILPGAGSGTDHQSQTVCACTSQGGLVPLSGGE